MTKYNDPYGIERANSKERLERERNKSNDLLMEQIVKELKNISERLNEIESRA